jgi:hypothetical protein
MDHCRQCPSCRLVCGLVVLVPRVLKRCLSKSLQQVATVKNRAAVPALSICPFCARLAVKLQRCSEARGSLASHRVATRIIGSCAVGEWLCVGVQVAACAMCTWRNCNFKKVRLFEIGHSQRIAEWSECAESQRDAAQRNVCAKRCRLMYVMGGAYQYPVLLFSVRTSWRFTVLVLASSPCSHSHTSNARDLANTESAGNKDMDSLGH